MRRLGHVDVLGGLLLIATGLFFALYGGAHYGFGELRKMGPGFFPIVLGWTLAGLGAIQLLTALRGEIVRAGPVAWRSGAAVLAGLAAFAWLVDKVGMVPSTVVLVCVVALAERTFRLGRTVALAAALAVLAVLIFAYGLGLPIPPFRWDA